jgi:hypothetical protein
MAPLDSYPLRPLLENPVFLRRQCHNQLAFHWSRDENATALSASGTHGNCGEEATDIQSTCPPPDYRLAERSISPASHGHKHQVASPAAYPGRSLDRDATTESILASPAHQSQPASRRPLVPAELLLIRFPFDDSDVTTGGAG